MVPMCRGGVYSWLWYGVQGWVQDLREGVSVGVGGGGGCGRGLTELHYTMRDTERNE